MAINVLKSNAVSALSITRAAPGARVVVRDAEWLVRRADSTPSHGQQLTCTGISELVRICGH